jgi:hypothetical protein
MYRPTQSETLKMRKWIEVKIAGDVKMSGLTVETEDVMAGKNA